MASAQWSSSELGQPGLPAVPAASLMGTWKTAKFWTCCGLIAQQASGARGGGPEGPAWTLLPLGMVPISEGWVVPVSQILLEKQLREFSVRIFEALNKEG